MAKTIEELKSAAAVVRDATEERENTAMRIGQLFLDAIDTLGNVSVNGIKGFTAINSTNQLPKDPTSDQQQKGYLLGTMLYVYVGSGGNALDGKYQSAQLKGKEGSKGDSGVSLGDVVLVNDLTTGGESNALSAEQGKVLKEAIKSTLAQLGGMPERTERIDMSAFEVSDWWIDTNSHWNNRNHGWGAGIIVPLDDVKHIQIKGTTTKNGNKSQYALLRDFDPNDQYPHFVAGTMIVRNFGADDVAEIDVPDGATLLYLCVANGHGLDESVLPSSVAFTYPAKKGLEERISACEASRILAVDLTVKKAALLGDSITWLSLSSNPDRGWARYFARNMRFAELRNYARSGATWSNALTTVINTEENTTSISKDNVIFNQVQRLFLDIDTGFTPDYIVIAAGTNDVWFPEARPDALAKTAGEVMESEQRYTDTGVASCTSIAEAIRLVAELLWQRLPDVQVILLSPLQSTAVSYTKLRQTTEIMRDCVGYLGWDFISQMDEVPINRIREKWAYTYTYDGTHTSELGAKVVGDILSSKIHKLIDGNWSRPLHFNNNTIGE